jgi:hypothetical protein
VLVMFSLICPLPCLLGVLELAPSVSTVLIITLLTLETNSSIPRIHGIGQNNETITNTRANSSTARRHGSEQNNENITNTRANSSTPRKHGSGQNNENILAFDMTCCYHHVFLDKSWPVVKLQSSIRKTHVRYHDLVKCCGDIGVTMFYLLCII